MPTQVTRGTVRISKAGAIFRLALGVLFVGFGIQRYVTYGRWDYISPSIGLLFIAYGLASLFLQKKLSSKIELEKTVPPATDRLAELLQLKTDGLISPEEYETKRQTILADL